MTEEVKSKLIRSCNTISNEAKNLTEIKQKLLTASDLCTKDAISINEMNMKESIETLGLDIDKINTQTKKFIEDVNEEIMIMSRVV